MALVRTDPRANRWRACLRVAVDSNQKQNNLERTKNHETDTKLIQHNHRHRGVSVDGWVRHHNDHYTGKSEHARSRRL